jgi:hypothetical protein
VLKNAVRQNRAWAADLNKGHKLEDDGLRQAKYDIVHKGWTNKWGGFHWVRTPTPTRAQLLWPNFGVEWLLLRWGEQMRIVPKTPLMGSQVNRLPQEEIDACRAKLDRKT